MTEERYGSPVPNDLVAGQRAPEGVDPARSTGARTETRTPGHAGSDEDGQAQRVIDRADAGIDRAAEGMQTAADQVRERAEQLPGGERTGQLAQRAADTMESAAGYMREHDVNDMASDFQRIVRDHPKEALIAAAAIGFLVGKAMRR
jgi:ElaB/YqjD/DUF883 family membrane-anchored ribosome-binding protein